MKLNIKKTLRKAISAHKEGNLQEAEGLYITILHSHPQHSDANQNLGVLQTNKLIQFFQNKQYDDATKLAQSLTEKFPKHQLAWKLLGALLGQNGRYTEALNATQTAATLPPQDSEVYYNMGIILKELGKLNEAEASYRQAIALKADYAEAYSNLGVTLHELGKFNEAEAIYRQAIALKADYAEVYSNLGVTLHELGKFNEAEAIYRQAIALKADYAKAHSNLGITLKELDKFNEAEASYRQAIALKADYPEVYNDLGVTLHNLGKLNEAEASYRQAIALKADYAEAHRNLGVTLQTFGKFNEAEASYRQAIALKADYAEAHLNLTSIKKFHSQDEQYLKMQEIYLDKGTLEEQRCQINFGLAKACEDLGDFKHAFKHFSEGNALRKKLRNYDISQDEKLFEQIKINYQPIAQHSVDLDKIEKKLTPIFIIGMPRSGTTLIEQIISSDNEVTGAGELLFIDKFGHSMASGFSKVSKKALMGFRQEYLSELQNISNGNSIVTDKMPHNFLYLGLISAALPEAKIVHVKREPAALCWANYKQYFGTKGLSYCYDLADIISYHRLYENLMEFWKNSIGKRIYDLDYELLTTKQENETRNLIDFLGFDWDEKYLLPQNNKRTVQTASNIQIRKKVYQGSSQQWKKYKPFLDGALDVFK